MMPNELSRAQTALVSVDNWEAAIFHLDNAGRESDHQCGVECVEHLNGCRTFLIYSHRGKGVAGIFADSFIRGLTAALSATAADLESWDSRLRDEHAGLLNSLSLSCLVVNIQSGNSRVEIQALEHAPPLYLRSETGDCSAVVPNLKECNNSHACIDGIIWTLDMKPLSSLILISHDLASLVSSRDQYKAELAACRHMSALDASIHFGELLALNNGNLPISLIWLRHV